MPYGNTPTERAPGSGLTIIGLAVALVVGLIGVTQTPAEAAPATDLFVDDDRSVHEPGIDAVRRAGIVRGCNPPDNDRFCPERKVTRAEMATLLARMGGLEPSQAPHRDVQFSVHRGYIGAISSAGITKGCNPPRGDRFCPNRSVTRGEMAAFLFRSMDMEPRGSGFADTRGHIFAAEMATLGAEGVILGCNPPQNTRACPDRSISRGEAATMIARAMGLRQIPVDHPDQEPPGGGDDGGEGGGAQGGGGDGGEGSGGGEALPPGEGPDMASNPDYPGQPAPGYVLWGAFIDNQDPERHEGPAGATMTLNRTFWQWSQRNASGLRGHLSDDARSGRVSWVSFKPPASWAQTASGQYDNQIDDLLRLLDSYGHPVWLTIHHEPEDNVGSDGSVADHLAMNRKFRQRMNAVGTRNVALSLVLMSWTFDGASNRNPDAYWDGSVYDFLGVDPYVCQKNESHCQDYSIHEDMYSGRGWPAIRNWAAARGVDVGVAEWGMRGSGSDAGQRVRDWYQAAVDSHNDGGGARVVGLAAFDSGANSPGGSWVLQGGQLEAFRDLISHQRTAAP